MNPQPSIHSSLPDDIALKIASSLEVRGVCSLGSCSRFWRQLCGSDCVWEPLCRDRWPGLALDQQASSTSYGYPADLDHNLQAEYLMEVLHSCNISDRQVHVQWWKLGRWFYGFRMRDELHARNISLGDLVTCKDKEVLGVLRRGAVYEVLRIQISPAKSETQRQDSR